MGKASFAGEKGGKERKERDALVVVGHVAGEGGEADVGRERENGAVRREAFSPLVPCRCQPRSVCPIDTNVE